MAKRSTPKGGTSRVRFIMLEAEMPEGDLTQITNAIQNALKPETKSIPRAPARPAHVLPTESGNGNDEHVEFVEAEVEVDENRDQEVEVNKSRSSKPRKPPSRKILDIDLDSDVSFASYVERYPVKTELDRYIVAVAFFHEHRDIDEGITADHVYTCFRKLNWSTGKKDFAQPLRNLKRDQLIEKGPSNGTYIINHIGLDRVHKLADG